MVFHLTQRALFLASTCAFSLILPGLQLTGMQLSFESANQGTALAAQPAATSMVAELKLSDQQKRSIRAIHKTRNQEISKVLNATQRKTLAQALRSGTKLGAAMQTLNLSAEQKQKISTILRKSNQEIRATLTPKQQQQLEAYRKQHQSTAQGPIE